MTGGPIWQIIVINYLWKSKEGFKGEKKKFEVVRSLSEKLV